MAERGDTFTLPPIDGAVEEAFYERRFTELAGKVEEQARYIDGLRGLVASLEAQLATAREEQAASRAPMPRPWPKLSQTSSESPNAAPATLADQDVTAD